MTSILLIAGFLIGALLMQWRGRLFRWVERKRSEYAVRRHTRFQRKQDRDLAHLAKRTLAPGDKARICTALGSRGLDVIGTWGTVIVIARKPKVARSTDAEIIEVLQGCTPDVQWIPGGTTHALRFFRSYTAPASLA